MTRATTTTLAVAADYADAMMAARRGKNWLFLILLIILLLQLGIFFTARYAPSIHVTPNVTSTATGTTATTESTEITVVQRPPEGAPRVENRLISPLLEYLIDVSVFLGTTLVIVLAITLLLIVTIMLVGRLVGVAHVTSAFLCCVVLMVMLFPWQALLNSHGEWVRLTRDVKGHKSGDLIQVDASQANAFIASDAGERAAPRPTPDVRIPGVLYTWSELVAGYGFPTGLSTYSVLKWMRFVGWPVIAIIILLSIQARSSRGLRFALGESEMHVEIANPPA